MFYVCASVGMLLNNWTICTVQQQEYFVYFRNFAGNNMLCYDMLCYRTAVGRAGIWLPALRLTETRPVPLEFSFHC